MRYTTLIIPYPLCHDALSHDKWETTEPSVYGLRFIKSEPKQILCPVVFSCVFFIVILKGSHSPQVCLSHGYLKSLHKLFPLLILFLLNSGNPNPTQYLLWISLFSWPLLPTIHVSAPFFYSCCLSELHSLISGPSLPLDWSPPHIT